MDRETGYGEQGCPSAEEVALLGRWHAFAGGVRRLSDELLEDVAATAGLSPSSFQVLWFLANAPDQSAPMNQLSATLGFSTAGTTKVADRLAAAGMIERRPSATDRRVIFARLTDAGGDVARMAGSALAAALRKRIVDPLGDDEFARLAEVVAALARPPGHHCE
jgi:DNA-binding MarR family transcriptional regulator